MGEAVVEVYSGYRYGERPRAFVWRGRRYDVLDVERRWRSPRGPGFLVTAVPMTGALSPTRWELKYDEVQDRWHIRCVTIEGDLSEETGS